MKIAAHIAATLLGLGFIMFSLMILLNLVTPPPADKMPPMVAQFMGVFGPSGWLKFVKTFELIGGILVLIPKTRNFGLLVLGPIVINILAFHVLVEGGNDIAVPAVLGALALFLLICERQRFLGLLR